MGGCERGEERSGEAGGLAGIPWPTARRTGVGRIRGRVPRGRGDRYRHIVGLLSSGWVSGRWWSSESDGRVEMGRWCSVVSSEQVDSTSRWREPVLVVVVGRGGAGREVSRCGVRGGGRLRRSGHAGARLSGLGGAECVRAMLRGGVVVVCAVVRVVFMFSGLGEDERRRDRDKSRRRGG
jgi:hypothetical protein